MKDKKYYKKLAKECARIADTKKAENIKVYDVENKTGLFYFSVILTAISQPHIKAIEEEITKKMKKDMGEHILHRDGINSTYWKVLDYGGIVIHIFDQQTREFYALDKIYEDCRKISWKIIRRKKSSKK